MKILVNLDGVPDCMDIPANVRVDGVGLFRPEHSVSVNLLPNFYGRLIAFAIWGIEDAPADVYLISEMAKRLEIDIRAMQDQLGTSTVVMRLLDPPIGEFITLGNYAEIANEIFEVVSERAYWIRDIEQVRSKILRTRENGMLGLRGLRLNMRFPRLMAPQLAAIHRVPGTKILLPMIADPWEVSAFLKVYHDYCKDTDEKPREVGAMLETPAACYNAGQLARLCDFLSFGTNDLQQMTYGVCRDDQLLYEALETMSTSTIDQSYGDMLVGPATWDLMHMAVRLAREANPNIVIGACGDSASRVDHVMSYKALGLDYLSVTIDAVEMLRDELKNYSV